MKLAILHHHLNPGGVTQVIMNHLRAISRLSAHREVPEEVLVLHGGRADAWPDGFEQSLSGIPVRRQVLPALDYDSVSGEQLGGRALGERLRGALMESSFDASATVLHIHNPSLCKTAALPTAISHLANAGYRCLLQIHDFAEDFRSENLAHCHRVWAGSDPPITDDDLYPQAAQVHYGTLTGRDASTLRDAGIAGARIHQLPNPVIAQPPEIDRNAARQKLQSAFGIAPDRRLLLYPVRGIRRKNIGEAVLWAALGRQQAAVAITLPPKNPVEYAVYREWQSFAGELSIGCFFDVGELGGISYDENLAAADAMLTTSVAEGFGMVFLECFLRGKTLVGRNLPEITADFLSAGVRFDGMYDTLRVPLELFDVERAKASFRALFDEVTSAFGRQPIQEAKLEASWHGLTSERTLDFAYLDQQAQWSVIRAVVEDAGAGVALLEVNPGVAAALADDWQPDQQVVEANARAIRSSFSAEATGEALLDALAKVSSATIGAVESLATSSRVLDKFLEPERFHPLRLERARGPEIASVFRSLSRPLDPNPTGEEPKLKSLQPLRAIIFDIYGTMLISASGEVGSADDGASAEDAKAEAFQQAWLASGLPDCLPTDQLQRGPQQLVETILQHHSVAKAGGVQFPEVDIVQVWRDALAPMIGGREQTDAPELAGSQLERFAAEYEARVNPVWPMPGLVETLARFRDHGLILGIVSNAQFFTPAIFPALVDRTLEQLGFRTNLLFFSYRFGRAKPGSAMFDQAISQLDNFGISPEKALYVGNDMRNDVMPAARAGMRTALFAGDQRSLRWRSDDPSVAGVQPDVIVTALSQLVDCLA